jgi:hypothetical protein
MAPMSFFSIKGQTEEGCDWVAMVEAWDAKYDSERL